MIDNLDDMGMPDVPDLDDLASGTIPVNVNKEFSGIKINLQGQIVNLDFGGVSGTLEGPDNSFLLNLSLSKDADNYIINGEGNFIKEPLEGIITASVYADSNFEIDFSSLQTNAEVSISKEINTILVNLSGNLENGRLTNLEGIVQDSSGAYIINTTVIDNGEGYTISGNGSFSVGPIEGEVNAQIQTNDSFNIDANTLDINGSAVVDKEVSGIIINLSGSLENGRLASLVGTLQGPGGSYIINASVVDNGDNYTITGGGSFTAGPINGSVNAQIDTDSSFNINPESLNIGGDVSYDNIIATNQINLNGVMENNRLSSLNGSIIGPNGMYNISVSVIDNGDSYTISGEGLFNAGPLEGTIGAQVDTDNSFNINPSSFNIDGEVTVDTNFSGVQINMTGTVENSRFVSLIGNLVGPNQMFDLSVGVVDNGDSYTISGSGDFTAGPAIGTLTGEIIADSNLNPDINTLNVGGSVNVDTNLAGNQITMSGTMDHNSLQSLVGTIEGPNGMYLLEASVEDNGEGYTITGSGNFHVGPIDGTVTGEIQTDSNFTPDFNTLNISGEANVDTETAGHHIQMHGVMENGRLVTLEGTVVGPEDLYTITASIEDNGEGYTIIGDGQIDKGIIQGSVHGEIDTDSNFTPDFETLNFNGEVTIKTESAGQKIAGTAVVNNGFLESISATMEGPGGLYTLYAQGVREEKGYDLEGGAGFTFFEANLKFGPPPILIPTPVPGLNVEISADMGFNAKAQAEVIAGIKTDHHFVPDISTFEIRAATLLAHAELFISLFGGLNVNLGFASASAGVKAKLSAIIDMWMTLTGDSKGMKMQGNMYGALMGALYAAIKLRFLFFKKEFDFLIVEGKVASVEKDFGPEDFTIENLIKAFSFGMDDLSLPGKDRKGKPPDLKAQAKNDEINDKVDASRKDDEDAKEKENNPDGDESSTESGDNNNDSSENSNNNSSSVTEKSRDTSGDDWGMQDDGGGGGRVRGDFGGDQKSEKNDDTAQLKSKDIFQLKSKKKESGFDDIDTAQLKSKDSLQLKSKKKESGFDDIDPTQLKSNDSLQFKSNRNDSDFDNINTIQLKTNNSSSNNDKPVQKKSSSNLPNQLKSGVENLSGQNMSDVNVNYNSNEPSKLNAHAFAQGNQIHLGPGQEKHLPHEAWHVAQQKQGRVNPTKQLKSKVNINDDSNLEKEADVMGEKALKEGAKLNSISNDIQENANNSKHVKQLKSFDKLMNNDISDSNSKNNIFNTDSDKIDNTSDTISLTNET